MTTKEELFNNISKEISTDLKSLAVLTKYDKNAVDAAFYRTFVNSSYTEGTGFDDKCNVALNILYNQYDLERIEPRMPKATIQEEQPLLKLDAEGLLGLPNYNYIRQYMDYIKSPEIYPEIAYQNGLASVSAFTLKRVFAETENMHGVLFKDPLFCNVFLLVLAFTAAGKTIPLKAAMGIVEQVMKEGIFVDGSSPESLKENLADEIIGGEKKKSKKEEEPEECEEESETQELTDKEITVSISYEKPVVVTKVTKAQKETENSKTETGDVKEPETPKEDVPQPEVPKAVPDVISLTTRYNPFTQKWVSQPIINGKKQASVQHKKPIYERETGRDKELKSIITSVLGIKPKDAEDAVNKLQSEAVKVEGDLNAIKRSGDKKAKEEPADISKYPNSWKNMWDDEIGGFFTGTNKQFMLGMVELLCKLYSCMSVSKSNAGGSSNNTKIYNVKDSFFSINGATVSDDLAKVLSVSMIVRGLLPRFMILNPDYKLEMPDETEEHDDIENVFDAVNNSKSITISERNAEKREALVKAGNIIDALLDNDKLKIDFTPNAFTIIKNWEIRSQKHYQDNLFIMKMRSRFMENAYKLAILIEVGNIPYYVVENVGEGFSGELKIEGDYTDVENIEDYIDKLLDFDMELLKDAKIKQLIVTPSTMKFALKMFDRMYLPHSLKVAESLLAGSDNGGGDNNKGDIAQIKSIMKEQPIMTKKDLLTAFGGSLRHLDTALETLKECCMIFSSGEDENGRPTKDTVYQYRKKVETLTLPEKNYANYAGTSYQAGLILSLTVPSGEMVDQVSEVQQSEEEYCSY